MSTYVGLHCNTCDEHSGNSFNHGEDIVKSMLKALPHLVAALKVDTGWLQISYMGDCENVFNFAAEHFGHELIVQNEYGETYEV